MASTPLCGSLVTSRRSFLALAWTLTTLLSFFSFGVSVFLGMKITHHYNSILTDDYAAWYLDEYGREYNDNGNSHNNCRLLNSNDQNRNEGNQQGQQQQQGEQHNNDREGYHLNDQPLDEEFFESLDTTNSRGLVFAGVYTTVLGIALSLYGSTVVVGFISAKGEYIPPCFSFRDMSVIDEDEWGANNDEDSTTGPKKLWGETIHRGVFLGSLVIFSNLMLLCAVIFGELQVRDYKQEHHNLFHYRIEKISNVFAITCVVLAFVYILFAVIFTSCGGMSNDGDYNHTFRGGVNQYYEMSVHKGGGVWQMHHRRRQMNSSMQREESVVGGGPPGGITNIEGFITDMVSSSSGSSVGSNPWERGKHFAGQLA